MSVAGSPLVVRARPTHACRVCGARYYGENAASACCDGVPVLLGGERV